MSMNPSEWLTKKLVFVRRHQEKVEFSEDAFKYLRERYKEVRSARKDGRVPVNPRVLEGWFRIAHAMALFRHAWLTDGQVSVRDAERAVDLWLRTTGRVVTMEDSSLDFDRLEGVDSAQRDRYAAITETLRALDAERGGDGVSFDDLYGVLSGVSKDQLTESLNYLCTQGDVFQPKPDRWKVLA